MKPSLHRTLFYSLTLSLVAACTGEPIAAPPRADDPFIRPGVGRSFILKRSEEPDATPHATSRVWVERATGTDFSLFERELAETCADPSEGRFNFLPPYDETQYAPPAGDEAFESLVDVSDFQTDGQSEPIIPCGRTGAQLQAFYTCMGYRFSTLADSVLPWGVAGTPNFNPGDLAEAIDPVRIDPRFSTEPEVVARAPYVVPVQNASDSATLALLAADYFRRSALVGAASVDPAICQDSSALSAQVLAGGLGEQGGLDEDRFTTLGFVLMAGIQEALDQSQEAVDLSRAKISAAAREKLSADGDEARARTELWRGAVDSRLEMAGLLAGVPWNLFEPPKDGELTMLGAVVPPSALPTGAMPIADTTRTDPEVGRARDVLTQLGVDIRLTDEQLNSGMLEQRVRAAFTEDFPVAAEDLDAEVTTDDEFIMTMGLAPSLLRSAADQLLTGAEVAGRTLVDDPDRPGRIRGLQSQVPLSGAFLFASTAGAGHFDEFRSSYEPDAPSFAYAYRGHLNALDFVAGATRRAVAGHGDALERAAQELAGATDRQIREEIPMRLAFCVGPPAPTTAAITLPSSAFLKLYGVNPGLTDERASQIYEVWLGDAGLECATTGAISGVDCDPADYRFTTAPMVVDDASDSGLGSGAVVWELSSDGLPPLVAEAASYRIYVTRRVDGPGSAREDLAGIDLEPGDDEGETSRCLTVPVGEDVNEETTEAVGSSTPEPSEPSMSCAGLEFEFELPLEDELTEASTGRDDIESSFARFLSLARQAADEADLLGEQLIEQGLSADQRAEQARDELETICGGVVNVADLMPEVAPVSCSSDADCTDGCPDDASDEECSRYCDDGFCVGSIASLPSLNDTDRASLERCIGAAGVQSVTLGQDPLCVYRLDGGPPCKCPGNEEACEDAPACPHRPRGTETCDDVYGDLIASSGLDGLRTERVTPLQLVDPSEVGGGEPPDCYSLARLRSESFLFTTRDDVLDNVLSQSWLSQAGTRAAASSIRVQGDYLGFMSITRGGKDWLSTGSFRDGYEPAASNFPCEADSRAADWIGCLGAEPDAGYSLLCGLERSFAGSCTGDPDARIQAGQRLGRAVEVLAALSGAQPQLYRGGRESLPKSAIANTTTPPSWLGSVLGLSEADTRFLGQVVHFETVDDHAGGYCLSVPLERDDMLPDAEDVVLAVSPRRPLFIDGLRREDFGPGRPGVDWLCLADRPFGSDTDNPDPFIPTEPDAAELVLDGDDESQARQVRTLLWDLSRSETGVVGRSPAYASYTVRGLLEATSRSRDARLSNVTEVIGEPQYASPRRRYDAGLGQYVGTQDITHGEVLDALELACLASEQGPSGCSADLSVLPNIENAADLVKLERYLDCAASRIEQIADQIILPDLPSDLVVDLRERIVTATVPANRGVQGETVAQLRGALEDIHASTRIIGTVLRDFSLNMQIIRGTLTIDQLEQKLTRLQTVGQIAQAVVNCASGGFGAAAACGAAATQIAVAVGTQIFREQIMDVERQQTLANALLQFSAAMDRLNEAQRGLAQSTANVSSLIAQHGRNKESARRAAARVLGLDRDDVGREYNVNRVLRARNSLLADRYEAAKNRAIRMAWIARRALEQRIGFDLSTMSEDLDLVEAPATWADRVCSLTGIDYDTLRNPDLPIPEFDDLYVGEYVRRLELTLESYRFRYPFTDGDDSVVLSLRDDLQKTRVQCFLPEANLLASSGDFLAAPPAGEPPAVGGWIRTCDAGEYCGALLPVSETIGSGDGAIREGPFMSFEEEGLLRPGGDAVAFELQAAAPIDGFGGLDPTEARSVAPGWSQAGSLVAGTYYATWYERLAEPILPTAAQEAACATECDGACDPAHTRCSCLERCRSQACGEASPGAPSLGVEVVGLRGDSDPPAVDVTGAMYLAPTSDPWVDACRWRRAFAEVDMLETTDARIAFTFAAGGDPGDLEPVVWAAAQLETPPSVDGAMTFAPSAFIGTNEEALRIALCSDDRGEAFRTGLTWRYGCDQLCPDGFGSSCSADREGGRVVDRCYYETTFGITLDDIERGDLILSGGFALGNFNYRHIGLGVNVVGTGVLDCSNSRTPDACYSSGFVPYSLRHDGPYRVRNHEGTVFPPADRPDQLFVGNIEHAKGLAAERFLTNPVSSADQSLMSGYVRGEFLGRPLEGNYTLRIWDVEGLDWSRLEDVQVLLNYRYWTRFE